MPRVATYNLHHCRGPDERVDVPRVASAIRDLDAQLIALQELDRNMRRSEKVDQPEVLAALTGLRIEFFPTLVLDGQEFGIAVATSDPLELHYEPLPHTGEDRPHGVVIAWGEELTMMATHLSRRPRARRAEIIGLIDIARACMRPLLLAGDLNDELSGLGSLESVGFDCRMPRMPTFPAAHPARQVDHLLPGRGITLAGLHTRVTHASDHLPLIGDAIVKGRKRARVEA